MSNSRVRVQFKIGRISTTGTYNILTFGILFFVLLSSIKPFTIDILLSDLMNNGIPLEPVNASLSEIQVEPLEEVIANSDKGSSVKGGAVKALKREYNAGIEAKDLRIKALEDTFRQYQSPLEAHAEDFIIAADKYHIENWQLIPAIGLAETLGCTTGTTHYQRNCWGWGGADPTRVLFPDYETAIDVISATMIDTYGDEHMNAKDIQGTYCGASCAEYGYRWAKGVNFYLVIINDNGEKYDLPRTNEIDTF